MAAAAILPPEPRPVVSAPWQARGVEIVNRLCAHPRRYARWQAYKPLSRSTVEYYRFGLGRLPFERAGRWYWSRDEWLTVPLFEDGRLVGLRGRNLGTQGPKWISATGTHYCLWNLESVRRGVVLWICENYVDAAWLMGVHPEYVAVALGGASNWKSEWATAVAERQPALVMIALDNDLAGQATGGCTAGCWPNAGASTRDCRISRRMARKSPTR